MEARQGSDSRSEAERTRINYFTDLINLIRDNATARPGEDEAIPGLPGMRWISSRGTLTSYCLLPTVYYQPCFVFHFQDSCGGFFDTLFVVIVLLRQRRQVADHLDGFLRVGDHEHVVSGH